MYCSERMDSALKRILSLLCALCLVCLTGCADSVNSFTWFVDAIPANLDPQVASRSEDVTACTNLYVGLLRKDPEGNLAAACCERYEVSPDGLTYTFYLKDGLTYKARRGADTEYEVTADDFVFAFRRIYSPGTASPYTDDFSAIENSAAVLAGAMEQSALGVSAPDRLTVVFRLSQPDEAFLEKLTLPGAAPCNQAFFEGTQGTYGLTTASTITNGSFYLYNWTSSGLFLRRAADGDRIDSLRLVENSDSAGLTAAQLILEERCSAALDDTGDETALGAIPYTDTTWCLLFNQRNDALANVHMRAALTAAAQAAGLPGEGSARFGAALGLIPDGAGIDGLDYRAEAGCILSEQGDSRELYAAALEEGAAPSAAGLTLLVPEGSDLAGLAQTLNGCWQKELSLFFSIETVPLEELSARLASGKYTLALAPLQLTKDDPLAILGQFTSGGMTGYSSEAYDALYAQAAAAGGRRRLELCAQAERLLADDFVVCPLFCQNKRLLVADGITGLLFDPYGPILDLAYTQKPRSN